MANKVSKQHTGRTSPKYKELDEAGAAFPVRFRVLRLHLGLSELEMSQRLGMSLISWQRWERGQRKGVSIKMFCRLRQTFNVSLDWLMTECVAAYSPGTRNDNLPLTPDGRPIRVHGRMA